MKKKIVFFICFFLFLAQLSAAAVQYKVLITGVKNRELLNKIKGISELIVLQKHPPRSINALRYRADGDLIQIKKLLSANGYYDAFINTQLIETKKQILVKINIFLQTPYILSSYQVYACPLTDKKKIVACENISIKDLGLELGQRAISQDIINARLKLLSQFSLCGYPLSTIEKQDTIVDSSDKQMHVELCIDKGPLCHFGPITMIGLKTINPSFIEKKIMWKEGRIYSPKKIEETQKRLLKSDLFSSVLITHAGQISDHDQLPIKVHLAESKHKNISIGVSYATIERFGTSFVWANRNFRSLGELLSLEAVIAQRYYAGTATYKKPDFKRLDQDFFTQLQVSREKIHVYLAFTYGATARIDRKFNKNWLASWGLTGEFINVTRSINNGKYMLLALALFGKYTTANSLLNPWKGFSLSYIPTPYSSVGNHKSFFLKQRLLWEHYLPVTNSDVFVFAYRLQFGSILGPPLKRLPMTKLFFGGSDDDLRGYRYRTVSPKNSKGDPKGGLSAIYLSIEPRFRLTKLIGLVPFFDLGTVSIKQYPNPSHKWYKSTGIGLRYYTLFGPFKLDIAFPLNRRKSIDPRYRIYVNIGQTF